MSCIASGEQQPCYPLMDAKCPNGYVGYVGGTTQQKLGRMRHASFCLKEPDTFSTGPVFKARLNVCATLSAATLVAMDDQEDSGAERVRDAYATGRSVPSRNTWESILHSMATTLLYRGNVVVIRVGCIAFNGDVPSFICSC